MVTPYGLEMNELEMNELEMRPLYAWQSTASRTRCVCFMALLPLLVSDCQLQACSMPDPRNQAIMPDCPEIRHRLCLIERPIKLTLSLTTSTQAVVRILLYIYIGARSALL